MDDLDDELFSSLRRGNGSSPLGRRDKPGATKISSDSGNVINQPSRTKGVRFAAQPTAVTVSSETKVPPKRNLSESTKSEKPQTELTKSPPGATATEVHGAGAPHKLDLSKFANVDRPQNEITKSPSQTTSDDLHGTEAPHKLDLSKSSDITGERSTKTTTHPKNAVSADQTRAQNEGSQQLGKDLFDDVTNSDDPEGFSDEPSGQSTTAKTDLQPVASAPKSTNKVTAEATVDEPASKGYVPSGVGGGGGRRRGGPGLSRKTNSLSPDLKPASSKVLPWENKKTSSSINSSNKQTPTSGSESEEAGVPHPSYGEVAIRKHGKAGESNPVKTNPSTALPNSTETLDVHFTESLKSKMETSAFSPEVNSPRKSDIQTHDTENLHKGHAAVQSQSEEHGRSAQRDMLAMASNTSGDRTITGMSGEMPPLHSSGGDNSKSAFGGVRLRHRSENKNRSSDASLTRKAEQESANTSVERLLSEDTSGKINIAPSTHTSSTSGDSQQTKQQSAYRPSTDTDILLRERDAEISQLKQLLVAKEKEVETVRQQAKEDLDHAKRLHEERVKSIEVVYEAKTSTAATFKTHHDQLLRHSEGQSRSIEDLVRNVGASISKLDGLQTNLESGILNRADERECAAKASEERTRELHDFAKQLSRDTERERGKLQEAVAKIEILMRDLRESRSQANSAVQQESSRVLMLLEHHEQERLRTAADLDRERAELRAERESIERDRKAMMVEISEERRSFAKDRAAALTLRKEIDERSQRETAKHMALQAEIDDATRAIERDSADIERRAADVKRNHGELEQMRRRVGQERDEVEGEKAKLEFLAETLKTRSIELVAFHKELEKEKSNNLNALAQAKALNAHTADRNAQLDRKEEELLRLDAAIQDQRLRLAKDMRALQAANSAYVAGAVQDRTAEENRKQLIATQAELNAITAAYNEVVMRATPTSAQPVTSQVAPSEHRASARADQSLNFEKRTSEECGGLPLRIRQKIKQWNTTLDEELAQLSAPQLINY